MSPASYASRQAPSRCSFRPARPAGSSSNFWISTPRGANSSTMIRRPRWQSSASPRQTSHPASRGTSIPWSAITYPSGTQPAATQTPASTKRIGPMRSAAGPGTPEFDCKSGREDGGNIRGLPAMNSKNALKRVLHSLVYRITAHGGSRLYRGFNPTQSCAQLPTLSADATIREPTANFDTRTLLRFLPRTGTIGHASLQHHILGYAVTYVPFVPMDGPTPRSRSSKIR